MCIVSNIGDFYHQQWQPYVQPIPNTSSWTIIPPVSRAEFDALKRDVEEMKELMRAAKRMDELLGQPDCEMAEKLAVLRKVAELVGVDLDDLAKGVNP